MKKGFTLIELIIVVAIVGILATSLYSVYQISSKSAQRTSTQGELVQNGRIAMDRMIREIRQTNEIVDRGEEQSNNEINEIEFQDAHASEIEIQYIKYYLEGDKLKRQVLYYYFEAGIYAGVRVAWDDVDEDGKSPLGKEVKDEIIAEYIEGLEFYKGKDYYGGELELVNIDFNVQKDQIKIDFRSQALARNI